MAEWQRRERESPIHWWLKKPGAQNSESPKWVAEVQVLRTLSATFPVTLTGSWMESREYQHSISKGHWHCKWQLDPLHLPPNPVRWANSFNSHSCLPTNHPCSATSKRNTNNHLPLHLDQCRPTAGPGATMLPGEQCWMNVPIQPVWGLRTHTATSPLNDITKAWRGTQKQFLRGTVKRPEMNHIAISNWSKFLPGPRYSSQPT